MLLNANCSVCVGEVDPASPLTLLTPDSCRQYLFPRGFDNSMGLKRKAKSHGKEAIL